MKPDPDPALERQLEEYAARWAQTFAASININLGQLYTIAIKWGELDESSVVSKLLRGGETKDLLTERLGDKILEHYDALRKLTN